MRFLNGAANPQFSPVVGNATLWEFFADGDSISLRKLRSADRSDGFVFGR